VRFVSSALALIALAVAAGMPRTASADDEPAVVAPERRPFRMGLTNEFWVGFSGPLSNPVPSYDLALEMSFPTGRRARYHVEIGFETLNGYDGIRVAPLTIGYAIPVPELTQGLRVEVELLLDIVKAEVLFGDHFAVALSSGLRAQVVASYGLGFVAFCPLGFQVRYAYGVEDTGITTGGGADWPFMFTLGVEL